MNSRSPLQWLASHQFRNAMTDEELHLFAKLNPKDRVVFLAHRHPLELLFMVLALAAAIYFISVPIIQLSVWMRS